MKNVFVFKNDQDAPLLLNIEPEGDMRTLSPQERITIIDTYTKFPVTISLSKFNDDIIITLWPGDGSVDIS